MRIFLISVILCINIIAIILFFIKSPNLQSTPQLPILADELRSVTEVPPIIDAINKQNSKIQNILCKDVTFYTGKNGFMVKCDGQMIYEKDLKFRMFVRSVFGLELDLGSNQKYFWYWSRREKKSCLYYSDHKDFEKTRLKTPFNPLFIKSSLGLDPINTKNAVFAETDKDVIVTTDERNSMGDTIHYSVIIDKKIQQIRAYLITDIQNNPVVLVEIRKRSNNIPLEVIYFWFEESHKLLVCLNNPIINTNIGEDCWTIPNLKPMVNMAEDSTY